MVWPVKILNIKWCCWKLWFPPSEYTNGFTVMVWKLHICRVHPYPTLLKVPQLWELYRTRQPALPHSSGNLYSPGCSAYRRKMWTRRQTLALTQKHMTQLYQKAQGHHTDRDMELIWAAWNCQQYGTILIQGFGSLCNSKNNPRTKGGTYGIR